MYLLIRFVFLIAVGMALAWAGLAALMYGFAGTLAAIAVLFIAHRRWPSIRLRYYLWHRGWPLPALAWAAGGGAEFAIWFLYMAVTGGGLGRVYSLLIAVGCAVVSAVCTYSLRLVFEGKLMKDLFAAIPADQRGEFDTFLAGAPAGTFADFSKLDQDKVTAAIRARVIGQDEVVAEVVSTAFRRAALRRPGRPLANFLFVGPTGVGKTELSKALALELFDDRVIEIACNELPEQGASARLVGMPRGYQGAAEGGWLCREIGRLGTGMILFDEIEKCDPQVLKTIMTLLDKGTLTEQSSGHTFDARGFLIVLTSNARAAEIGEIAAHATDPLERDARVKDELAGANFLPEELGRLDGIFPFKPLDRRSVARIAWLLANRVATNAGVVLESIDSGALVDFIERQEKVSKYGIRQLDKMIEKTIGDSLIALRNRGITHAGIRITAAGVTAEPANATGTDGAAVAAATAGASASRTARA